MQEQKIILYIITKIKPEDTDLILYEFKIKDFCEICGIDMTSGKNYAMLKKTIKKLADKSSWVTIKIENMGEVETLLRWIEKPYIDSKSGIIKIKLDSDMKPFLLELKERFTVYNLYYTLAMKSKYSIRLYEILKSYEFQKSCTFEIEEFKKILCAETYKLFGHLKEKVLDISIREINDFGDIFATYELEKQGRKFHKIKFIIKTKKDAKERFETFNRIGGEINQKQMKKDMK